MTMSATTQLIDDIADRMPSSIRLAQVAVTFRQGSREYTHWISTTAVEFSQVDLAAHLTDLIQREFAKAKEQTNG